MNIGDEVVFDTNKTGKIISIIGNNCTIRETDTNYTYYRMKSVLKFSKSFKEKLIQLWA